MQIPEITCDGQSFGSFQFFAKGFMGEVYKGKDGHGKPVILKLSRPTIAVYEQQLENEIRVCREMHHPNIVKTLASGKLILNCIEGDCAEKCTNVYRAEGGAEDCAEYYYMLQEFYEGGNLKSRIRPGIPLETCMDWFRQIVAGVKAFHEKFVHRDLKPENILIDSKGNLCIADFGLAKVLGGAGDPTYSSAKNDFAKSSATKDPFNGWGTVEYMAPECWTFGETTPATDIYSLGIMFYEILTGELPCKSHKAKDLKEFHLHQPLPRLADPSLAGLQECLDAMTAKKPEDRRLYDFR